MTVPFARRPKRHPTRADLPIDMFSAIMGGMKRQIVEGNDYSVLPAIEVRFLSRLRRLFGRKQGAEPPSHDGPESSTD